MCIIKYLINICVACANEFRFDHRALATLLAKSDPRAFGWLLRPPPGALRAAATFSASSAAAVSQPLAVDYVLGTRLDSDDALHASFVATVQV